MKILHLAVFIFVFCIFLFSFGARNISSEFKGDESFYFRSAKEMLETGDVMTPRYMGKERFQKPPFFYWLIFSSFRIFGVNWFAARLPSIVFGALCAFLIFAISNLFFEDAKIGLFAALFSATTPLYYRYARLAVPDMALVFFITLALYYFVRLYKNREDRISSALFFAALAFAVLIKGPVGLVIPLLIIIIFRLIKKEKKFFGPANLITGAIIFVLIISPWFYIMYRAHGGAYLNHVWSREILQRLGQGHSGFFIIRCFKGLGFYLGALITKFLPYSLFMPLAFVSGIRVLSPRFLKTETENKKGTYLFLILWITIVFFFFAIIAEKRAHYLLALSPAASILIALSFKKAIFDKQFFSKIGFKLPYMLTLIAISAFTALFIFSGYISEGDKIPIWKYTLVAVPIVLILGFRLKNSGFMPLSLILSLAVLYSATAISSPLGLFTNKMERAATVIKREFKEGDRVGIGSHGIIPEELQVFFELPVENVKVRYNRDGTPNFESASPLLRLLRSREKTFCVIKRKNYDIFIPEERKGSLYILDSYYVWKRRIRFDRELKDSFKKNGFGLLREIFQNEIYIISNRK